MKRLYLLSLMLVVVAYVNISCRSSHNGDECVTQTSVKKLLDGVQTSWDGADLIDYPSGKPSITMLRITVAPKSRLPQHYHPVINVGYMLEGSLTVTDDKGNVKTVCAGEPLVETVNTIHYGENRGDTKAVILVFYAGEEGGEITKSVEN